MRKFLWAVGVAAFVFAMTAPAWAMDFTFFGQTRVRFFDLSGVGFDSSQTTNPGNNPRGAEVRFRAGFQASDDNGNVQGVLRMRIGNVVFGSGGGTQNPNNTASVANDSNVLTSGAAVSTTNSGGVFSGARTGSSSGGGLGTRGVNEETEWAYLDFKVPFIDLPLRLRSGLIPWYLPKGMIIDDNAAGVQAYGSSGMFTYRIAWYRLEQEARFAGSYVRTAPNGLGWASRYQAGTIDDSYDVYEAKLDAKIADWLNPGLYFDYGDNRDNCVADRSMGIANGCPGQDRIRPNWFLGFTDTGKIGIATYDIDFIYGWAKGGMGGDFVQGSINGTLSAAEQSATGAALCTGTGPVGTTCPNSATPITTRGYALDAGIHIPVGPVTWSVVGSYATGDKQNGSTTSDAFPGGYSPAWNGPGGAYQILGNAGPWFDMMTMTQSSMTGLWTLGTYFDYNPVKAMSVRLAYAYAGFTSKNANCATYVPGSIGCYGPLYFGSGFVGNASGISIGGDSGTFAKQGSGGLAGASALGHDLEVLSIYQLYTGLKIIGTMAWMVPTHGDVAAKYGLSFQYDF